jgi:hypothetical protein
MADTKHPASSRNDSDLHDEPATPAQSGTGGGRMASEIGSRDEARNALGGDPEPTRATKRDKVRPFIATQSDQGGARC